MPDPHNPLRILQLNSARLFVGEAAHTLNLTEALRRRGHLVFLGLREGHRTYETAQKRGLEPTGFVMKHRWWPTHDLPDLKQIARMVRQHGIQAIHAHRGKDHWLAVLAAKFHRLKTPVIRTRHVTTPLRAHVANRWLARRTARLVAVSRAVEEDVRGSKVYPAEHVVRIPGGIDLAFYQSKKGRVAARAHLGLEAEAEAAVCIARFATVKAHRILVEAWKQVVATRPKAVLLLVGDGALYQEVQQQVKAAKLSASVRFLGWMEYDRIPEVLEAADCGVLSSIGSEGFSRAVLEYMAMGLPAVATCVGAVPDLVADGVNGRLVAPGDPAALATALGETLEAGAAQRQRWGAEGRRRAEAAHGYETWAAAHEKMYREVLTPDA